MVPDSRLRLSAVLKALDDIVTPAIPEAENFAHEQLALMKKSIRIVIDQIPHEYAFTVRDAKDFTSLAEDLAGRLPQGDANRGRLSSMLEQGKAVTPATIPNRQALEDYVRDLRGAIEDVVDSIFAAPLDDARRDMQGVILDHCERQTLRERAWTIATGFESDPSAIPPVEQLIYDSAPTDKAG